MQSKTSFFNRALFLWNAKRFWPLWGGYTLFWFVVGPMVTAAQLNSGITKPFALAHQIINTADAIAPAATAIAAVFFAMALYSYMYQSRSVVMVHSLPLRRETLYATNFISGIVFFVGAHLVAALGITLLCAFYGMLDLYAIAVWFAVTTVSAAFFFGFASFCAQFTGQILALPVFYGILNFLVVGLESLVRCLAMKILFGYSESGRLLLSPLSPIVKMYSSLNCYYIYDETVVDAPLTPIAYEAEGLSCLLWYALAGLAFALLGFLLYRRRSSEAAGDTVSVAWAKPIFSAGVGLCCALSLGQGVYELISNAQIDECLLNFPKMLICMILSGLIGYYAAEMLMRKTFRVFKETVVGAAVLCVLLGAGLSVLTLDLPDYEKKLPALNEIESVYLDTDFARSVHSAFSAEEDPQVVAALLDVHQSIINDKDRQLALRRELWHEGVAASMEESYTAPVDMSPAVPEEPLERVTSYFRIRYILTDGTTLERQYDLSVLRSDLAQEGSLTAKLDRALNDETVLLRSRLFWRRDKSSFDAAKIIDAEIVRYANDGESEYQDKRLELDQAEARRLFDALLRDFSSGGIHSDLFDPRNNYYFSGTDISFTFSENGSYYDSRTIALEPGMTYVSAVLRELGF